MKIIWSTDKEDILKYYILLSRRVQQGFYQDLRCAFLPYEKDLFWTYPDYGLLQNSNYNNLIAQINGEIWPSKPPSELQKAIADRITKSITASDTISARATFDGIINEYVSDLSILFPNQLPYSIIKIVPTPFGTGSSFIPDPTSNTLIITWRPRLGHEAILMSLLSQSIIHSERFNNNLPSWKYRTKITDFLAFHTSLSKYFTNARFSETLQSINEVPGDIAIESADYFKKLGYPVKQCFTYDKSTIFYNKIPLTHLENKEIQIFKHLIDKKSQIITFDELADIYWQDKSDEKFSLYSLAKVIEKLRKSLERNNIPSIYIHTIRKQGYALYD